MDWEARARRRAAQIRRNGGLYTLPDGTTAYASKEDDESVSTTVSVEGMGGRPPVHRIRLAFEAKAYGRLYATGTITGQSGQTLKVESVDDIRPGDVVVLVVAVCTVVNV